MQSSSSRKRRLSFAQPEPAQPLDVSAEAITKQAVLDALEMAIEYGQEHLRNQHTKRAEERERAVREACQDITRPDHLRLRDELSKMGISSNQPVEAILHAVERQTAILNPTLKQFQKEWTTYVRFLHKHNHERFEKQTAETGRGYFKQLVSKLTFDQLFSNPMWEAADEFVERTRQFPMLISDPAFHKFQQAEREEELSHRRGHPGCSWQAHEAKLKVKATEEKDALLLPVPRESLKEYVDLTVGQADSVARCRVFTDAIKAFIDPLIEQAKRSATRMDSELAKLEVYENLPVIDAIGTVQSLCDELRAAWQQNLTSKDSQAIEHADVEQFLANIQFKADQMEQESRPIFATYQRYDKQLNAWVHLQTKLARTGLVCLRLTELRNKAAAAVRRIDHILRLNHDTPTSNKKHKPGLELDTKEEKKQKQETDLPALVTTLHEQFAQFQQHKEMYEKALQEAPDEKGDVIAGTTLQDALDENRGVLYTAAVHLDFVDWLRSVLTAIGTSFMIAEDQKGQLANRVNAAITGSKSVTHKHIDTIREYEAKIIDGVKNGLQEELQDSKMWVQSRFLESFTATQSYYQEELRQMEGQINLARHKRHPPWHKLRLTPKDANAVLLELRRELSVLATTQIGIAAQDGLISKAAFEIVNDPNETAMTEGDDDSIEELEHRIVQIATAYVIAAYAVE